MSTSSKPSGSRRPAKQWAVSTLRHYQPRGVRSQGRRPGRLERKGAVTVLAALFLTATFGFVALSVDFSLLYTAQSRLHCSASAAALAAASRWNQWADRSADDQEQQLRYAAAGRDVVVRKPPSIDLNYAPRADGDSSNN